MLARKVPNGAGEGKSRLPERHQPRSIASTAAPQYHPQSSSVANGTRTDKQAADVARTAPPLGSLFQGRR